MEYLINVWQGRLNTDTAPVFRTSDAKLFWEKVEEIKKQYKVTRQTGRLVYRDNLTVFSFCRGLDDGFKSFQFTRFFDCPRIVRNF